MMDWSGFEQASAALEEVTAPSAKEEVEATPTGGEEVASRRGGLEATKASYGSALRGPEIAPEAIETPIQEEVAGPSEDPLAIVVEAPKAPSDENYLHTAFEYTREEQSMRIIWDKQTGYGFVEFVSHAPAEKILQPIRLNWVAFGTKEVRFGLNDVRRAVTNAVAGVAAVSVADVAVLQNLLLTTISRLDG
jgi:hypothetical protein